MTANGAELRLVNRLNRLIHRAVARPFLAGLLGLGLLAAGWLYWQLRLPSPR